MAKMLQNNFPEKISAHITFAEAIKSNTAIKYGIKKNAAKKINSSRIPC